VIRRLRRAELPSDTIELARFLIGKVVVHELPAGRVSGRIVETEAYPPGDPAGHHFRGPTPRIRSMYLEPGHAYVFFNYGAHFMLNVSGEPAGTAGGILIRAVEPLEGIELMKKHRKCSDLLSLTCGPGRLAAAFQINRSHDGIDLCAENKLWLGVITGESAQSDAQRVIGETVRIGITRAADHVLRFYEAGNPFVSGPRRLLEARNVVSARKIEPSTTTEVAALPRAKSKKDFGAGRPATFAAEAVRKKVRKKVGPRTEE
jgi:DNA-3-methyladenine glycosylase